MTQPNTDPDFPMRTSASFLATATMQGAGILIIVEGKDNDPYVYSKLIQAGRTSAQVQFAIIRIENVDQSSIGLSKGTSGKHAIINLFKELQRRGELSGRIAVDKYCCLFMLDKDLDDSKAAKISNPHVVYTPNYDIESSLFENTNIVELIAASASADHLTVKSKIKYSGSREVAAIWRDWAALCYANDVLGIGSNIGFKPSKINVPFHDKTDPIALKNYRDSLVSDAYLKGIPETQVDSFIQQGLDIFDSGSFPISFKGKWFYHIISSAVRSHLAPYGFDTGGIDQKMKSSLRSLANYDLILWNELRVAIFEAESRLI
ncbi:DUF4435 domain-containing protein [Deinococcus puniceus]|uniref:DUF4435 domain-containing protein n=1 Tax=Deinococcus puniceus TaxID=1182568 RepID=UPI0009EDF12C|nr:DUF4435 domain-containing protein [Deinococcus puniceus]